MARWEKNSQRFSNCVGLPNKKRNHTSFLLALKKIENIWWKKSSVVSRCLVTPISSYSNLYQLNCIIHIWHKNFRVLTLEWRHIFWPMIMKIYISFASHWQNINDGYIFIPIWSSQRINHIVYINGNNYIFRPTRLKNILEMNSIKYVREHRSHIIHHKTESNFFFVLLTRKKKTLILL